MRLLSNKAPCYVYCPGLFARAKNNRLQSIISFMLSFQQRAFEDAFSLMFKVHPVGFISTLKGTSNVRPKVSAQTDRYLSVQNRWLSESLNIERGKLNTERIWNWFPLLME